MSPDAPKRAWAAIQTSWILKAESFTFATQRMQARAAMKTYVFLLIASLGLPGCANWGAGFGFGGRQQGGSAISAGTHYGVNLTLASDSRLVTGIFAGILIVEGVRHYVRDEDGNLISAGNSTDPAPGRRISEQDCTRPIVNDGANLMCR